MIKAEFELSSPLCVSSGEGTAADKDVILDYKGRPFIPGTSIAGALRAYLPEKERKSAFGYADANASCESQIIVYDAPIEQGYISVRDGVALDSGKIAEDTAKYDYEIVETGALVTIRLQLTRHKPIRNPDAADKTPPAQPAGIDTLIESARGLINGITNGDIRFGAKKTRGLGRLALRKALCEDFTQENARDYINFKWSDMKKPFILTDGFQSKMRKYVIPLELLGGLSIRSYSSRIDGPDFTQLSIKNGRTNSPVIPGSTWNGAFRHRAYDILTELGLSRDDAEKKLRLAFGEKAESDKAGDVKGGASRIVFSESIIKNGKWAPVTRNRINRFDGSTMKGALYTELSYFGGECALEVFMPEDSGFDWMWGLVLLTLKDLENGFLAIGGQTAVGRGLFGVTKPLGEIIAGNDQQKYIDALNMALGSGGITVEA